MPWNWNVHGEKVGRPAEAATKATWQDYDAQYLKRMLLNGSETVDRADFGSYQEYEDYRSRQNRFNTDQLALTAGGFNTDQPAGLNMPSKAVEKQVYLQEIAKNYERDAEACLKAEFKEWLQGTHSE